MRSFLIVGWVALVLAACGSDGSSGAGADAGGGPADSGESSGAGSGSDGGADAGDADEARTDAGSGDAGEGDAADEPPPEPVAVADGSDGCEPGELVNEDDDCVPACTLVVCSDHGACSLDEDNQVLCDCETGYAGNSCETCATDFAEDGEGACAALCDLTDCGNGSCSVQAGAAVCQCHEGYAGDACDACAPGYALLPNPFADPTCELAVPATTGMSLWLDANDEDSVSLVGDAVSAWESLVGTGLNFAAPAATNRPTHEPHSIRGRLAMVFDGVDDVLTDSFTIGGNYSVFMVAKVTDETGDKTLMSGVTAQNKFGFWLRASNNGGTLAYRHKTPDGASEDVTLTGLDLTQASLIEVHRQGGIIPTLSIVVGDASEGVVLSAEPLPSLSVEIGRRADSDAALLDGALYEVIVVSPAVPSNQRAAYRDYLKAKWYLD